MATLQDYYDDLLRWEGLTPQSLVDQWPSALRKDIEGDFSAGIQASGIKGAFCPIKPGSSNQSVGNQVEDFTVSTLGPHLSSFRLLNCSGPGYPDKMLVQSSPYLAIPLEMKATSNWDPKDSNRRVLTSSSKKLRTTFCSPIYHLLATVMYSRVPGGVVINGLRLDFLEPGSPVNVRLEASVSHKLLAQASHASRTF